MPCAEAELPPYTYSQAPVGFLQPLYASPDAQSGLFIPQLPTRDMSWLSYNLMAQPAHCPKGARASRRRRPRNARARRPSPSHTRPANTEVSEQELENPNTSTFGMNLILEGPDSLSGNPKGLLSDPDAANAVVSKLEGGKQAQRAKIIGWLQPGMLELSLSEKGCWVIQKALEVAGGEDRASLVEALKGHVQGLVESPFGNYVLQKSIECMPPYHVQFILDELSMFEGGWVGVAKHRFGCRVAERLLEFCTEDMTAPLAEAITAEADVLARHPFANYVVQHVLEYGCQENRTRVIQAMINGDVCMLAQHRVASNVVERALDRGNLKGQRAIASALLTVPPTLLLMGCSRYGSFAARRLLDVLSGPLHDQAICQLVAGFAQLKASKYGKQLAEKVHACAAQKGFFLQ